MNQAVYVLGLLSLLAASATADEPPLGKWKVTELTGAITTVNGGPEPPLGLCTEQGVEIVEAIPTDDRTFVYIDKFLHDESGEKIRSSHYWSMDQCNPKSAADGAQPPPGMNQEESFDPTHQFFFSFAFDNGHHSNEVLKGLDLHLRDWSDDDTYPGLEFLCGELAGLILPGEQKSFYVGELAWDAADRIGRVFAMSILTHKGFGSGMSRFVVEGVFLGPKTISGHWEFEEQKEGFGCTQTSAGKGRWTAEAQ